MELTFTKISKCLVIQNVPSQSLLDLLINIFTAANVSKYVDFKILTVDGLDDGVVDSSLTLLIRNYSHQIRKDAIQMRKAEHYLQFNNVSVMRLTEGRQSFGYQSLYRIMLLPNEMSRQCFVINPLALRFRSITISFVSIVNKCGSVYYYQEHLTYFITLQYTSFHKYSLFKSYWHVERDGSCNASTLSKDRFVFQHARFDAPAFYIYTQERELYFLGNDESLVIGLVKACNCSTLFHYRVTETLVLIQTHPFPNLPILEVNQQRKR